jgi:ribosome-associated protein
MDIRKLQRAIVDGLEDVKAQNIAVFNTEHLSPLFERVIIASGTSNRQTKALASSVRETVKKRGMDVLRTEGEDNGEWIIVDCGAAVAHILQPAIRDYYNLEEIWGGKSVKMKLGDKTSGLVKASEPAPQPSAARAGSAKAGSAKAATGKAANAKAANAKAAPAKAAPATGAAAKAAAPRKAAPRKAAPQTPAARKGAEQKVANRTAAFKRVAAKKAPARKAGAAASPARKAAAGKPAARPARKG